VKKGEFTVKNHLLVEHFRASPARTGKKEISISRNVNKMAVLREHALRHDRVDMTVPVDEVAERLNRAYHCRNAAITVDFKPENIADGIVCRPAELSQKLPVESKIHPQPFRYREYPLPVRYLGKNFILKPVCKQQGPLLVAPFDKAQGRRWAT
jgi:hypothetical protein